MTTSRSPLSALKAQADEIARLLKAAERREPVPADFAAKLDAARGKPAFKAGVVMDDKVIVLEIPWASIRTWGEVALAKWILDQMRKEPPRMAEPRHEAFYQDFVALVAKHGALLGADEMLAIASNAVGKLVALQDQRVMTGEAAMKIVADNIEKGNQQALAEVAATPPAGSA